MKSRGVGLRHHRTNELTVKRNNNEKSPKTRAFSCVKVEIKRKNKSGKIRKRNNRPKKEKKKKKKG